jgi:hypothetical protein
MNWPVYMPSLAIKVSVWSLNRYGSRKTTFARGAPRPGSWIISLTIPLTYPWRSACDNYKPSKSTRPSEYYIRSRLNGISLGIFVIGCGRWKSNHDLYVGFYNIHKHSIDPTRALCAYLMTLPCCRELANVKHSTEQYFLWNPVHKIAQILK